MTPQGAVTEFALTRIKRIPYFLAVGADGNIWFTEPSNNKIGRITP